MSATEVEAPSVPFEYPKEAMLVELGSLDLENRARTDYGDLQELADSIQEVGLIHPPTIDDNGKLLAGGRRTRAMQLLGATMIPVVSRSNLSSYQQKEIELHENVQRLNMKWQEKVMLIYDAHRLRSHEGALQGRPWYQKDTGALFNQSAAHVSNAIKLAERLVEMDEEILNAPKVSDAVQLLIERAEKTAMEEQVKRHGTHETAPVAPSKTTADVVVIDPDNMDPTASVMPTEMSSAPVKSSSELAKTVFDLGDMCHLGNCLDVMDQLQPGSINHVLSDPPYGIDVDVMEIQNKETIAETHTMETYLELMPKFLEKSYRLIGTKGGFCVFFYDLDHHEKLQQWAQQVGFEVCKWPFIWIKTHQCQNKSAQYNPTKTTEYAMICRRNGEMPTTLMKNWPKNYLMCDASAERKMYTNPFAKPAALWNEILDHIAMPGQAILDPCAGQFSSGRAILNKGMKPVMIEVDKYHFQRGVEAFINQISEMTSNKAEFTNNPLERMAVK